MLQQTATQLNVKIHSHPSINIRITRDSLRAMPLTRKWFEYHHCHSLISQDQTNNFHHRIISQTPNNAFNKVIAKYNKLRLHHEELFSMERIIYSFMPNCWR
jgi:hypothetical protein